MKNRERCFTLLVSVLLLSLLMTNIPYSTDLQETSSQTENIGNHDITINLEKKEHLAGVVHAPITIGSDDEFNTTAFVEGWVGNGLQGSPFIIENYDIDRGGASGHCINIQNTSVYFVVRGCYLTGATQLSDAGVYLWNVSNCEISNNIFFNNSVGIYGRLENCMISENLVDVGVGGDRCIAFYHTNYTQIVGNNITGPNNGIRISNGVSNEIRNNHIEMSNGDAMNFSNVDNSTISENHCSGGSIMGIELFLCDNNLFDNNLCIDNYIGIGLYTSANNLIDFCSILGNYDGIKVDDSSLNRILGCNISDNTNDGVFVEPGTANIIVWNEFWNNTGDHIVNAATSTGIDFNFYDDYIGSDMNGDGYGEEAYSIPGVGSFDYHPLVFQPGIVEWSHTLVDKTVELGDMFSYDINVTSASPVYNWEIDNGQYSMLDDDDYELLITSQYFMIDNDGVLSDKGNLKVGIYQFGIYATNLYGFSTAAGLTVTVEDTTSPSWITEVRDRTYNSGSWIEFQIVAWDLAGIESWTINDNENFTMIEESYEEAGIATIVNTRILDSGEYQLHLEVTDVNGNSETMDFIVTVGDGFTGYTSGPDFGPILSGAAIGIAGVGLILGLLAILITKKQSGK